MTELPPASTDKSIRENDLFVFLMPSREPHDLVMCDYVFANTVVAVKPGFRERRVLSQLCKLELKK